MSAPSPGHKPCQLSAVGLNPKDMGIEVSLDPSIRGCLFTEKKHN